MIVMSVMIVALLMPVGFLRNGPLAELSWAHALLSRVEMGVADRVELTAAVSVATS